MVPDAEGHSLRRVRTVLWVLRGENDRLPRGSVKRREQLRTSRILPGKGAVGWSRVRQTEVQNMQHIQVGKWACAPRGGQAGSEGSMGTDGKGIQCLLGLVLFCGWGSVSHIGFLDRSDEKDHLGGHEEPN